jgi:hypothetical protein
MEHSITILMVSAFLVLAVAMTLDFAHREFTKKRKEYRMGQALRRGLAQSDLAQSDTDDRTPARPPQMLQWQSCENTSLPWS